MSQVIGVVLIVVITVLLAGVTASFVFAFDDETQTESPSFAPETTFDNDFEGDGQTLTIQHASGDSIETDTLTVRVQDATVQSSGDSADYVGTVLADQLSGEFTSGTEVVLNKTHFEEGGSPLGSSEYVNLEDATVLIVWEDPDSQQSDVIYRCDVEYPGCEKSST